MPAVQQKCAAFRTKKKKKKKFQIPSAVQASAAFKQAIKIQHTSLLLK